MRCVVIQDWLLLAYLFFYTLLNMRKLDALQKLSCGFFTVFLTEPTNQKTMLLILYSSIKKVRKVYSNVVIYEAMFQIDFL